MNKKKLNKIYIYPSYSLRDYKNNVYLLNSDPEFQQVIAEAEVLTEFFLEVFLIIPEKNQRLLDVKSIPSNIKTIEKKYEHNVGTERFTSSIKFIKSLKLKENDIFYSGFLYKWKDIVNAGISIKNTVFSFWYIYPDFDINDFDSNQLSQSDIICRSAKQKNILVSQLPKLNSSCHFILPYHGKNKIQDPIVNKAKIRSLKSNHVVLPTRFDHEDHTHTWEALSILLPLKQEFNFKLILCNPNNSGDLSHLKNVVDVIGPLKKSEFEKILNEKIGIIFAKKECDFDGSKGAPEYMASNLIFISNDYKYNPFDMQNDNERAKNLIRTALLFNTDDYVKFKLQQKEIVKNLNGKEQMRKTFKKILKKKGDKK